MNLKTLNGIVDVNDTHFAKGGEGTVHDVVGNRNVVAKLYHKKGRTSEREKKILAMINKPPVGSVAKQIAWPSDILYTGAGEFVGFIMPRVSNTVELSSLYSNDKRNAYQKKFYIQVAQNLCAVVDSVHGAGHVVGDLNHANIHVDPNTALVTLVDTDSYTVNEGNGKIYPCGACMPEYIPKEISDFMDSGNSLRSAPADTFNRHTDNFALAIHIFKLLMNGAHPYACRVVNTKYSGSQFTQEKNIKKGFFRPSQANCKDFLRRLSGKTNLQIPTCARALPSGMAHSIISKKIFRNVAASKIINIPPIIKNALTATVKIEFCA